MNVELTAAKPADVEADVLAMAASGLGVRKLDALFEVRLSRAAATADPVAVVPVTREVRARSVALVKLEGDEAGDLQLAAARAVRAHAGGGTLAWALDDMLPIAMNRQVPPVVEGAVLGAYDPGRWKSSAPKPGVDRFVVCGADEDEERLRDLAKHAELTARWTNLARELVDGPPNFVTPAALAERAGALPGLTVEVIDPTVAGLPALATVGGASVEAPKLIVLRYTPRAPPSGRCWGSWARPSRSTPAATSSSRSRTSCARRPTWPAGRRCSPRSAPSPSSSCRST